MIRFGVLEYILQRCYFSYVFLLYVISDYILVASKNQLSIYFLQFFVNKTYLVSRLQRKLILVVLFLHLFAKKRKLRRSEYTIIILIFTAFVV